MKKSKSNKKNNPDPYEDSVRLNNLDPYEAQIKSNISHTGKKKYIQ